METDIMPMNDITIKALYNFLVKEYDISDIPEEEFAKFVRANFDSPLEFLTKPVSTGHIEFYKTFGEE